jgi:hemolysin III
VDLWVNGLAIVAGFVGVIVLMAVAIPQGSLRLTVGLFVYSLGLLAMLICSAVYNARSAWPRNDLLRRLDHAAIFMMIAGTYTPFLAVKMDGGWGRWLLLYVWAVAGLGVALKLIWVKRFERLSVMLYLFLGWTILVAIEPLAASASLPAIVLLAAGRHPLQRGCAVSPLGAARLPAADLAWFRHGRRRLPLRCGPGRRPARHLHLMDQAGLLSKPLV